MSFLVIDGLYCMPRQSLVGIEYSAAFRSGGGGDQGDTGGVCTAV